MIGKKGCPHTHTLMHGLASSSYVTPELDRSFQDLGEIHKHLGNKLVGAREMSSVSLLNVELTTNGTRHNMLRELASPSHL